MIPTFLSASRRRALFAAVACCLVLVSCGPFGSDPQPTAPPDPNRPAAEGELSVGDVLAPINDAWQATTNERVTTQWGHDLRDADSSESQTTPNQESVAITIAPDNQYFVNKLGGVMMEEVIVVDDIVYARGPRMNKVIAPHADPETWVKVDAETLPEDEPMRYFLLARSKPAQAPFANLHKETLAQAATDIGDVEVRGKTCHAYTFTEDTVDMGQWDIEVSFDDATHLPCRLVRTTEGGYQAVSIFEYDISGLTLARPATWIPASPIGAATPVVGPLGLPSTGPLSTPVPATPVATPLTRGRTSIQ